MFLRRNESKDRITTTFGAKVVIKLTDIFVTSLILDEQIATKTEAIDAILDRLTETHLSRDHLLEMRTGILNRERLGSTGIGHGVAIPHTKHPGVSKLMGAVAFARQGLEFDSIDAEPVDLVFLLISPPEFPGTSTRVRPEAERLMRLLCEVTFRDRLRQSDSDNDLLRVIQEYEEWRAVGE
jgi:mannitol/fructose-specific phosphotransferase system IIA component (Ntr-type)